jgi:hypothetical protein
MAKKARKKAFNWLAGFIVVPFVVINTYAFWKLNDAAVSWVFSVFPNSMPETLTQLAIILAINNLIIIFLLIYVAVFK